MADVRALLKAKRQEARITHPYASYTASGQLRCIACGTPVKQASMWEGHIGSKAHRTAVMKMKAREEAEALQAQAQAKRKQSEEAEDEEMLEEERSSKRAKVDDETKGTATSGQTTTIPKGFPAGFFSDPSKAPILDDDGDEEDEDVTAAQPPAQSTEPKSQLDLEWEEFQKTVLKAPAVDEEAEEERQAAFSRATVFAEPELVRNEREGLPMDEAEETVEKPPPEETEEERRKRIEQEERELIMDRLIEEERAQEEADSRVGLLKMKVEQLKKAREMRRSMAKKSKS